MRQLEGKRVLITGGARGIGHAIALRLAAEGCKIVLTDLEQGLLPEAAAAISATGGEVSTHALDVTNGEAIAELRGRLNREEGAIDLLVNSAGVVFGGSFLEVPLEQHFLTYHINVLGLVAVTRAFLPDLIARPEAHIRVHCAEILGRIRARRGNRG